MRAATLALVLVVFVPSLAAAQANVFGLGTDLRLEGIVDPSEADKAQTLGTIKIRAGSMVRKFGVIRAQTAHVEGMSLFNRSELNPEQLLLRASDSLLDVFRTAAAGTRLRMLGRYQGDDYILAEVTPVTSTPNP